MSKERKKKSSVLSRQKPAKPRKKKRQSYFKRSFLLACAVVVPVLLAGLFFSLRQVTIWLDEWLDKPVTWQVRLNVSGDEPLPAEDVQEILATAKTELGPGNRRDMLRAAREIQRQGSFERVHFVKLSTNEMVLHVQKRQALLCVEADILRFVTRSGKIYGRAQRFGDHQSNCPGPIITGIFSPGVTYRKRQDQTLATTTEQAELVSEAVELYMLLRPLNTDVEAIRLEKFRGFSVVLRHTEHGTTTISLGRQPFSAKLSKLAEIQRGLVEKDQIAEHIELDYQGKAFIKLKKM